MKASRTALRTEASCKAMLLTKGKETNSSVSKIAEDAAEPANLTISMIHMLKVRYGLSSGSTYTMIGETPSKLHWLLQGGKHHVNINKDKEDDHWEWVTCGDIPISGKRKLEGIINAESDELKQLELLGEVTQLGTQWMALQHRNLKAYQLMLSQLAELEKSKVQEEEAEAPPWDP